MSRAAALLNFAALTGALLVLFGVGGPAALALPFAVLAGALLLRRPQVCLAAVTVTSVLWIVGAQRIPGAALLGPAQIACALALPSLAARWLRRDDGPTWAPHMLWLGGYGLVVLAAFVTARSSEMWGVSIQKHAMMVLPYVLLANLARTRQEVRLQVGVLYATVVCSALIGLGEYLMPGVEFSMGEVTLGARVDNVSLESTSIKRVTGGIGDGNWFSYTMASGIALGVYFFRRAVSPGARVLIGASLVVCLGALMLSYTRTGLVGLGVAVAVLVWQRRIAIRSLLAAAAVALVTAPLWVPPGFVERIFSVRYLKEGSTPIREEITRTALQLIAERPIAGWGYAQYGPQFMQRTQSEIGLMMVERDRSGEEDAHFLRAHNMVLDTAVQYGIPGALMLVMFMIGLLRECGQVMRLAKVPDDADLAVALGAALVAFYVCGMGGHSQELKIFWLLAGLTAAWRRAVLEDARSFAGAPEPSVTVYRHSESTP